MHAEIESIGTLLEQPADSSNQYKELLDLLAPVLTTETMQGFAFQKPHGYSGDYEIIDRIYIEWKSEKEDLVKWDEFFHFQKAPIAVRNRKRYFIELLAFVENTKEEIQVLNIVSGPGRDMLEFFQANPDAKVYFDCVDSDNDAIEYASNLCFLYMNKIKFINKNVFKYKPIRSYDLVWSAGLFDYLDNRQFVFLLRKLYSYLKPNGELVIGNFSKLNPSRKYMEVFGKWFLNHRGKQELIALAINAGVNDGNISVFSEALGVNLFLHVKNRLPM